MSNTREPRKVVLVTGASAGIGKAIAWRLMEDGWLVYAAARRLEKMRELESEGARILSLDVTREDDLQAAVETLIESEGRIDALVNNAGYGSYGAIEEVPIEEARRQFEVNVFGLARLSQLVLPAMREAGSGTIVNISSMGGRIWTPIGGWYHATKHAVEVLSDALRVETRPFGVRVVVVQPGAIRSEWAGIASDHLLAHSKHSAYQQQVDAMARTLGNSSLAVGPEVVAEAVSRAVNSDSPRRRYAVPRHARLLIFLHWLLPDWAWESLVKKVIN